MKQTHKTAMATIAGMVATMTLLMSPAEAQLAPVPGDFNGDGIVNSQDIAFVSSHWLEANYTGEDGVTSDGIFNAQDIALVSSDWLKTGPTQAQVIASLPAPPASAYTWANPNLSNFIMIGLTQPIAASANYGYGVTIGIVDTGIDPSLPAFANRISPSSGCSFGPSCTDGIYDDEGHGTEVAGIAAGGPESNGLVGIAPESTIVVEKLPDATGSMIIGTAAAAGAKVINVSQAPLEATAQSVAGSYEGSYVPGINAAANLGATVVLGGGNQSSPFVYGGNITGFTDATLNHIILVGAMNTSNQIASYSNTPGAGYAVGATMSASYQSLWLMAPANYETLVSGSPNATMYNEGTSLAAPTVAGAAALLDARWPVLIQNGTTAAVLFASATPLGDSSIYGNGLLNIAAAFQPIGGTYVLTSSGQSVPVGQVSSSVNASGAVVSAGQASGGIVSSGALGSVPTLSSALSSYTIFDKFHRNFKVDLSYLISHTSTFSSVEHAATAPKPWVSSTKFADGSSLSFGTMDNVSNGVDHPAGTVGNANWFISLSEPSGSTVAAGYGFPTSASFANALWGDDSPIASQESSLGVANALVSLTEGGQFVAFGNQIGKDTRVAFSWSQTQSPDMIANNGWATPDASAFGAGLSTHMTSFWTAGVNMGMLNEQGGLLGTMYDQSGPLSLGEQNRSMSMGVSSAFNLNDKTDLLIEATMVRTNGSSNNNSLISNVSPLYARSVGASLAERDTIDSGDHIQLSVKEPLRVISGNASLASTSVDANGNPITSTQNVSLRPTGNEMDLAVSYQTPVQDSIQWNVSLEDRHDADNVAGVSEVVGLVGATLQVLVAARMVHVGQQAVLNQMVATLWAMRS